jgi:hypothetical protein
VLQKSQEYQFLTKEKSMHKCPNCNVVLRVKTVTKIALFDILESNNASLINEDLQQVIDYYHTNLVPRKGELVTMKNEYELFSKVTGIKEISYSRFIKTLRLLGVRNQKFVRKGTNVYRMYIIS